MIYEITNTDRTHSLFDGWNETMIWSCLQGIMGKIYANDSQAPTAAMAVLGDFVFFCRHPRSGTDRLAGGPFWKQSERESVPEASSSCEPLSDPGSAKTAPGRNFSCSCTAPTPGRSPGMPPKKTPGVFPQRSSGRLFPVFPAVIPFLWSTSLCTGSVRQRNGAAIW